MILLVLHIPSLYSGMLFSLLPLPNSYFPNRPHLDVTFFMKPTPSSPGEMSLYSTPVAAFIIEWCYREWGKLTLATVGRECLWGGTFERRLEKWGRGRVEPVQRPWGVTWCTVVIESRSTQYMVSKEETEWTWSWRTGSLGLPSPWPNHPTFRHAELHTWKSLPLHPLIPMPGMCSLPSLIGNKILLILQGSVQNHLRNLPCFSRS